MNMKIDENFMDDLLREAKNNPRKRSHRTIHTDLNEPVQRLCIGVAKGTYVRPHYHASNNKWELLLVLKGTLGLVTFEYDGRIKERLTLSVGNMCGIEMDPETWHTIYPITDESVILEIKQGPYIPTEESDFASWAPEEGDQTVSNFLGWLEKAEIGDKY